MKQKNTAILRLKGQNIYVEFIYKKKMFDQKSQSQEKNKTKDKINIKIKSQRQ